MKYVVELGYKNSYEFDSAVAAVDFATTALTHRVERGQYDYATIHFKDGEPMPIKEDEDDERPY